MRNEPTLSDSDAQIAVAAIRDQLKAEGKAAVIAVADAQGELLAFLRTDGAKRAPIQIAMNKAFTAAREQRPSFEIGRDARHPERGFDIAYYGDSRYVGWGGGVPVVHAGQVIGAVGVSGLPEDEDMRLATLGVAAINKALRDSGLSQETQPSKHS
jgi:glc operon protein GlcG